MISKLRGLLCEFDLTNRAWHECRYWPRELTIWL